MILTYDAVDGAGKTTSDSIEAIDARHAMDQLRRRGLFVTSIAERPGETAESRTEPAARAAAATAHLSQKVLVLFTRQLSMLLRAGAGVVPALNSIRRDLRKDEHLLIVDALIHDLEGGSTFADALRKHPRTFDTVYCAVVAAGEAGGNLTQMFDRLALLVSRRRATRNRVLGALAYPTMLIVMCFGILNILAFFVIPRFAVMFDQLNVQMPVTTRMLLVSADFAREYWYAVLAVAAATVVVLTALIRGEAGRTWMSNLQTRIPVIGKVFNRLIQAQLLRTMGTLLESRVGVLDTVELARGLTRNSTFQQLLTGLEDAVTSGGQLSSAFEASGFVEPYVCQAVKTGEESGNLGGAITYCADMLDENNNELINTAMRLIEPSVLILMGLVVGGVSMSLFLPLFDLTGGIH